MAAPACMAVCLPCCSFAETASQGSSRSGACWMLRHPGQGELGPHDGLPALLLGRRRSKPGFRVDDLGLKVRVWGISRLRMLRKTSVVHAHLIRGCLQPWQAHQQRACTQPVRASPSSPSGGHVPTTIITPLHTHIMRPAAKQGLHLKHFVAGG